MRKLIVLSCVFLILSGILLAYPGIFPWAEESTAVSLLHIWAGIFFIVIFPLYSWDHIKGHSERLRKISLVTLTGLLQFFAGIGLIISGIPLLHPGDLWPLPLGQQKVLLPSQSPLELQSGWLAWSLRG